MVGAMNGAEAMIRTLVDAGVTTCFTNPGTSEMHFVAALDAVPEMRGVLGLFEGVATGAADGYARMAGVPACHAAAPRARARQRAGQPAQRPPGGDAGRQHRRRPRHVPRPLRRPAELRHRDRGAQRVAAGSGGPSAPPTCAGSPPRPSLAATARPGQVATLILPADVSWSDGAEPAAPALAGAPARRSTARPSSRSPRCCARASRSPCCSAGRRCARPSLDAAGRIAAGDRRPAVRRDVRRPHRARRRHPRRREAAVLRRDGRCSSSPGCATSCSSTPCRRCRSSPTPASRATSCPTAARSTCWRPGATTSPARSTRSPSSSAATAGAHRRRVARRSRPTGALTGATLAAAVAATMPDGRDRVATRAPRAGDLDGGRDRRLRAARLAAADRRGDRRGPAAGDRRRRRLPGPPGAQPRGRRLGDVHDPGAVDAGPGVARRDDRDPEQPVVRHLEHRARPHRRRRGRPEGPGPARPVPPRPRLRPASPRAWACRPSPCTRPTRRSRPWSGRSPNRARTSSRLSARLTGPYNGADRFRRQ